MDNLGNEVTPLEAILSRAGYVANLMNMRRGGRLSSMS
jgi:hypothetical protein